VPIEKLSDFIEQTRKFAEATGEKQGARRQARCWYRGQCKVSWTLEPKLYRDRIEAAKPTESEVKEILRLERHLVRDFRLISSSLRNGDESDAKLYFLEQHYGLPTRLLDWTTNPLIALYFSCADPNYKDQDGKVFMMDAYNLAKNPQPSGAPFGIATDRREEFKLWIQHIFDWKRLNKAKTTQQTFPICPEHFDRRISLQLGCFTFHIPNVGHWRLPETDPISSLTISRGMAKARLLEELAAVNIHEFSVYGDLEALARYLKRAYSFD
jgi:hypothetical protein